MDAKDAQKIVSAINDLNQSMKELVRVHKNVAENVAKSLHPAFQKVEGDESAGS